MIGETSHRRLLKKNHLKFLSQHQQLALTSKNNF